MEPQHKTIMTAQRRNFQRRRAAFAAVITLSSATRSAFAFTTPQPASSRGSMGGGSATRAAFVAPSHPLRIPAASSLEGLLSSAAAQSGLSSSTSLSMAGAGALAGCLTGGLFAGGLHAIAGKFSSRPGEAVRVRFFTNTSAEESVRFYEASGMFVKCFLPFLGSFSTCTKRRLLEMKTTLLPTTNK